MTDRLNCPYCPLQDSQDEIVLQNDTVIFVRNKKYQGALKHSGVIIPRVHRATVFDMTTEEIEATFLLLKEVKAWLDENYEPAGYNIGWNCEPAGGQEVMHAHMHVIPRFSAEPLAGKGIRSLLKSEANAW